MSDLISIVIPVYNAAQYLKRCLTSIMEQTYLNYEVILVNDGSEDNSLDICNDFAQNDNRIKVYSKENGGASSARNYGLKHCSGEYLVFVDSDDWVEPNYLNNLYQAAQIGDFDIVQCNFITVKSTDLKIEEDTRFTEEKVCEISKDEALNKRLYTVVVWGKIYKRYLFNDFKFINITMYEDDASYYIFIDRSEKIGLLNQQLYYYYLSNNSIMRNNKGVNLEFIEIYLDRIRYFKERQNKVLLDGSYDRFCLVLLLTFAYLERRYTYEKKKLWDLYKEYYLFVKKSPNIVFKDKLMFSIFRYLPRLSSAFIKRIRS